MNARDAIEHSNNEGVQWSEALEDFETDCRALQNDLVRQHVTRYRDQHCRQTFILRAYCGGCFRREHAVTSP